MRLTAIKSFAYGLGSTVGAPRLLQRIFARRGAAILMYHAVIRKPLPVADWCFLEEPYFQEQMQYLNKYCQVIPLRDVPTAIAATPRRPIVALTFDDGFHNNYEVAFPILSRLGLPATIFLATDFINSDDTPWFCRVNDALSRTPLGSIKWEGNSYDLGTPSARAQAHAAFQLRLKRSTHPELLDRTRRLIEALGDQPERPIQAGSAYRMLETREIREMARSGLIEFGAHTCSHAILSGLAQDERRREIADSLAAVEGLTGFPCTLFAYPNGYAGDYGHFDVAELERRKISIAVTTVPGPNYPSGSPLEMHRYGIGNDTSMALFKLLAHHVLWKFRN